MTDDRPARDAAAGEERGDFWARSERVRPAALRVDGGRPMGELLEEGIELSRFASEIAGTATPHDGDGGV